MVLCWHMQKAESRVSSDEDLKLSDLLRYYERESKAALVMPRQDMQLPYILCACTCACHSKH